MMSPDHLFGILCAHPFPGTTDLRMSSGACCFTAEHIALGYTHNGWISFGREIPDEMPHPSVIDAAQVHAEIHRVLAIVKSEEDRRRDLEAQLAKITAERDALIIAESTLSKIAAALAIPALEPHDDALSMVKRLVDGYTVVSQRLVGSQKEVAEVTKRATKAEAKVKRLLRQRNAAHAVLDEAAIGLEKEGARRWTLARRCRAAADQIWEGAGEDRSPDLLRLLDYHQAPIRFGDRALTTAERAAFVIRRLWQGRANAASESAALRRELSEITDAIAHLPDCAERSPIGQVTEYLNLNAAERIRLALPKG